jgi:hypothetical protein
LTTLREKQGLSVALVDVEDIYDEFSYGQKTPLAIRDFLAFAKTSWTKKRVPRFVLLAGDASLDPKNYFGLGDFDRVPTKLVDTQLMETASDDWFVDFNADTLPELAVGRLPARNLEEIDRMVTKIINYETSPPAESLLLIADQNDEFDFEAAIEQLRPLVPANIKVEDICRGQMDTATAKSKLMDAIKRGQKIVDYIGHGSVDRWRGNLMTSADALALTNAERLPLFLMMTCLNGYFQDPAMDGLAESLLKAEGGGAIAVWASSGMTFPDGQALINQQFFRLIFEGPIKGQPLTLGEAAALSKSSVGDYDTRRTWILFGDPTTRLK